jgi:hypothetical protein
MNTRGEHERTPRLLRMSVHEVFRRYPAQVALFYLGFAVLVFAVLWLISGPKEIVVVVAAGLAFGVVVNVLILAVKAFRSRS